MTARVRSQRGNRNSGAAGSGLTIERSGTLNGSSPTANLAGVNIKGNEAFFFISPSWQAAFHERCFAF
jgi:hypothetical protein